jgi:DNA-binding transcriptional ArsR family regulator
VRDRAKGEVKGAPRRARRPAPSSREAASSGLVAALDSPFLRALTEPARLDLLRVLLLHGPANVGTLAGHLPQDRSVISRHLKVLEQAGIVHGESQGRERVYALDGPGFVGTLERILEQARRLAACCCPAPPAGGAS